MSPFVASKVRVVGLRSAALAAVLALGAPPIAWAASVREITPVEKPFQFDRPQFKVKLIETSRFVRVNEARNDFEVSGAGLAVAVLDTGLRTTHVDFKGRVVAQRNFTDDNAGNLDDATDGNGHGTNVAGIIGADGDHTGMAPGASLVPIKVLANSGGGSFDDITDALQWVIDNRAKYNITVVNMSLGSTSNESDDAPTGMDELRDKIRKLRDQNVAVVAAAGNDFFRFKKQGMGYPAIIRETVSVGAVYDANSGPFGYKSGAVAHSTDAGRICPFSQRLQASSDKPRTDIFAPGAPVTSSGIDSDRGESVDHGTSQATPVTAGVILLLQELHLRATGKLPTVAAIEKYLSDGGVGIVDGDDEDDNVPHDKVEYRRLDAHSALQNLRNDLTKQAVLQQKAFQALDFAPDAKARFVNESIKRAEAAKNQ